MLIMYMKMLQRTSAGILRRSKWFGKRHFSNVKTAEKNKKVVVVGMSGGVDSSVAAYLLHQQQKYTVLGVYMQNWDDSDEIGEVSGECSTSLEYQDVKKVCEEIGIACQHVNFVKSYWNNVFSPSLENYSEGLTPNPDILCNREIKFQAFRNYAFEELGADYFATGHYARLQTGDDGLPKLYAGLDNQKDQSYFLSSVPSKSFENVLFPLGDMAKPEVRKIAHQAELCTAHKKDSVGICFIGKRNFGEFISQYVPKKRGYFYDIETGKNMGYHRGFCNYTIGQGAKLDGMADKWFVVGKVQKDNEVFVAPGTMHRSLFSDCLFIDVDDLNWIHYDKTIFKNSESDNSSKLLCRVRYRQGLTYCSASFVPQNEVGKHVCSFQQRLFKLNKSSSDKMYLRVDFKLPQRAVTQMQSVVFYNDQGLCYGGGPVSYTGLTYLELNKDLPKNAVDWSTS